MWRREIELEDFKSQQPEDAIKCSGGGCEKGRFGYQDQEFSLDALGCLLYIQIEIVNGKFDMSMKIMNVGIIRC